MNSRLNEFRVRVDAIMDHHLTAEIEITEKRIEDCIRPYVTFVQLEKNRITQTRSSLQKVKKDVHDIKSKI